MNRDAIERAAAHYEEISALKSGKRCGVQWAPWMDDWFTSWSPRNGNSNAEGPWAHWVDLAVRVLQDPMTAIVRPEVHEAMKEFEVRDFYSGADRYLSDDELTERFTSKETD